MNIKSGLINAFLFGLLGYVLDASVGIASYESWAITSLVALIALNILFSDL